MTTNITPRTLVILAALVAAIGLASSAVTAEFFIAGLQAMEADSTTRAALVAAGLLMIVAEVVAFFIAAMLPKGHSLRLPLLMAGVLLLSFETLTVFATQHALVQSGTAAQAASAARIDYLRANIAQMQAQSASLSATAQEQVGSRFIAQRETGSENLRTAQALQAQASSEVKELANLLASQKTTITDVFGQQGTIAYNAARAMLLTMTGLIMMSAAGALLRASRDTKTVPALLRKTTVPALRHWHHVTVPALSVSMAPMVWAMPAQTVPTLRPASVPTVPEPVAQQVPIQEDQPTPGPRYAAARAAVVDGTLTTPSVRAIQSVVGGNTSSARAIQACLAAEGLIERCGQGYRLTTKAQPFLFREPH
ncbi:MAG: hypothetical protein PHX60_15710 [Giesbergeria sp.]|uniref:hypothetical protein n=1 Tax=Giesbergeria sp. TaxID=2818473 RepID=UPI00260CB912|nr:hypothetical protein [Giesbergeria sp.]MDD2611098.1 hypothetical protein [Giesbergeria sp.]